MSAARKIDDDDFLVDMDERLTREAPELRALLKDTRIGQEIMGLVKDARDVVEEVKQIKRARRSPTETIVQHNVTAGGHVAADHKITAEREESWEAQAGEYRVTLNGAVLWACPFVKGDDASEREAEEGAALYAATLRDAIVRGRDGAQ